MIRRTRNAVALGAAAALFLGACSGDSGDSSESITFALYMTADSPQRAVLEEVIADFQEETGIDVELSYETSNYENNIKVQMAAGNLPDVFTTHGWSVLRYAEFLEPLTDRSWVERVNPGLDESMRDDDGTLYALPIEYTVAGINVNLDVLDQAGVDPAEIITWEDFENAAEAVQAVGISPITASGNSSSAGNLANYIASNAFTDEELTTFTNNEFDTDAWSQKVLDRVQTWQERDYFNPDYVSASLDDMASQLAQGQAAFALVPASSILATALQLNPDAQIGFIPIPSDAGERYVIGGEGINAYGVSKNSSNKEAALQFIDFLAEPENASRIAESLGSYSGLTDVEVDLGILQSSYDTWVAPAEIPTKPFFDRVYLPNGIWNTMIASTDAVITGQESPAQASEQMRIQFDTLQGQQD